MSTLGTALQFIGGVTDTITSAVQSKKNRELTKSTNLQNRAWALQDAATERAWSLADRQHEEEYNSPAAQMQRYKDAGLNPNLIYGSATNEATSTNETDISTPTATAPQSTMQTHFGDIANAMINTGIRERESRAKLAEDALRLLWAKEDRPLDRNIKLNESLMSDDKQENSARDRMYNASTIQSRLKNNQLESTLKEQQVEKYKNDIALSKLRLEELKSTIQNNVELSDLQLQLQQLRNNEAIDEHQFMQLNRGIKYFKELMNVVNAVRK